MSNSIGVSPRQIEVIISGFEYVEDCGHIFRVYLPRERITNIAKMLGYIKLEPGQIVVDEAALTTVLLEFEEDHGESASTRKLHAAYPVAREVKP